MTGRGTLSLARPKAYKCRAGIGETVMAETTGTREAAASFIAVSLGNLIQMAGQHEGLEVLAYLMEMARVEAEDHAG